MVCELCRFVITTDSKPDEAYLVYFLGYSQSACCIHRRYCMAERRYGISLWLLKKGANEWNIYSSQHKKTHLFMQSVQYWTYEYLSTVNALLGTPSQIAPPSITPPPSPTLFQGKKVNKPPSLLGPPPTPNYSSLINDRLYYAPINVMPAGAWHWDRTYVSCFHAWRMRRTVSKDLEIWRPTETSESWVHFTVLSPNFVCFGVFFINWTS